MLGGGGQGQHNDAPLEKQQEPLGSFMNGFFGGGRQDGGGGGAGGGGGGGREGGAGDDVQGAGVVRGGGGGGGGRGGGGGFPGGGLFSFMAPGNSISTIDKFSEVRVHGDAHSAVRGVPTFFEPFHLEGLFISTAS